MFTFLKLWLRATWNTRTCKKTRGAEKRKSSLSKEHKFLALETSRSLSPYRMLLGQTVSFQSSCVCSKLNCSSAGCICIPPHTTADWIFCSAAQIPLNWNFKWKLSRFAADQRSTWKHVMSHGEGTGLGKYWWAPTALHKTSEINLHSQ